MDSKRRIKHDQRRRVYAPKGIAPTIETPIGGGHIPLIAPTIRAEHHNIADIHFIVSEPANSTDMPDKSMPETLGISRSGETAEQLTLMDSPTSTCSVQDFLANLSQLLASDEDLRILEVHSSLKSAESLGLKDLAFYYLRTSRDSSPMMRGIHSKPSSERWMSWGMTVNGRCLTARTLGSRRTGSESLLLDILEEYPDPKYFLSERQIRYIVERGKPTLLPSDTTGTLQTSADSPWPTETPRIIVKG